MIITKTIKIDLAAKGILPAVDAVQDDKYSRNLALYLHQNGTVWPVPDGANAVVTYRKPDGTGGEYDTLPDGTKAWSAEGNVLTVALAPQVLTAAGNVQLTVTLTSGKNEISTFEICIQVQKKTDFTGKSEDYEHVTGFLPMPTGAAQVGQYLEISEVNPDGSVKALRPVEKPSGGEGGGTVKTVNGEAPDENGNVTVQMEWSAPTFDLVLLGLPAITPDGEPITLVADISALVAALIAGPVWLRFQINAGEVVATQAMVTAVYGQGMHQAVCFMSAGGMNLRVMFAFGDGRITAWCEIEKPAEELPDFEQEVF